MHFLGGLHFASSGRAAASLLYKHTTIYRAARRAGKESGKPREAHRRAASLQRICNRSGVSCGNLHSQFCYNSVY